MVDTFFPTTNGARTAKAWCHGCPVRTECLSRGLEETYGVWGGFDRRDRLRLLRVRTRLQHGAATEVGADLAALVSAGLDTSQAQTVLGLNEDQVVQLCLAATEAELEMSA